ncbi:hypothetical protein [Neorhizobium sp. JUb45]|uniref:hypothetical protein n=1 Tax=Neorhizobium sp. JUb45 TaxID=2485113 RepID=UPI00104C1189|nr:hypothetical protein [Neorhizobium sp. JUb45]TCR04077.1 hypothetical protein EDF70_102173 [Neorhizobium sp. JUb45]
MPAPPPPAFGRPAALPRGAVFLLFEMLSHPSTAIRESGNLGLRIHVGQMLGETTEMAKPQGKCIFCGGHGLTKEHVMPKWIRPLLARFGETPNHFRFRTGQAQIPFTNITSITPNIIPKQGYFLNQRLRVVCAKCNGGWMSGQESEAKPILSALIDANARPLNESDQLTIALWACLRAGIFERDHPETAAMKQFEYAHMHATKTPPENWRVFLARHDSEDWRIRLFHYPFYVFRPGQLRPANPNSHKTMIGLGSAVLLVAGSSADNAAKAIEALSPTNMAQVWPFVSSIEWPLTSSLGNEQLLALSYGSQIRSYSP